MYEDLSQNGTRQCECCWSLVCCPNTKLQNQFPNVYLLHVIQTQGENDWKEHRCWIHNRLRSKANTVIHQLHPWANCFTCLSLFSHF